MYVYIYIYNNNDYSSKMKYIYSSTMYNITYTDK